MAKVDYKDLLKKAISEFDTSKTTDVKGPMLDNIISYDGGGEMQTHKDAASILERYYFNEGADEGIEVTTETTEGGGLAKGKEERAKGPGKDEFTQDNEVKTGEEPDAIAATKTDTAKEVSDGEGGSKDVKIPANEADEADEAEGVELSEAEAAEQAVFEKLVAEMEALEEQEEMDVDAEVKKDDGGEKEEEGEEEEEEGEEEEEEGEKEEEKVEESSSGLGIVNNASRDMEELEESFRIFSEQIED